MSITVTPVKADFVAEISGIDLAQPLNPADRDAISEAIDRYAIVNIPRSETDRRPAGRVRQSFRPIHSSAQKARHTGIKHRLASNDIADISNLDGDSNILAPDSKRRLDWLANRLWHTDASFRAIPGALSLLYAHVIPDEGGDTEFADMRAAYDALSAKTKDLIAPMVAEHSIWHSRSQLAVSTSKYTDAELASLPPVPQRVVRTHPGSHRKTLYVASHASHILGMPVADGRLVLLDLIEHATQPQFVHRHSWREGDLVIWDNRCTMHRARPFGRQQGPRPAPRDDARRRLDPRTGGLEVGHDGGSRSPCDVPGVYRRLCRKTRGISRHYRRPPSALASPGRRRLPPCCASWSAARWTRKFPTRKSPSRFSAPCTSWAVRGTRSRSDLYFALFNGPADEVDALLGEAYDRDLAGNRHRYLRWRCRRLVRSHREYPGERGRQECRLWSRRRSSPGKAVSNDRL